MKQKAIVLNILFVGLLLSACAQQQDEQKNPYYQPKATGKLVVADADWKKVLSGKVYGIMREKDTEAPETGPYVHQVKKGVYHCASCGNPLFSSATKFDSHTGWPSFFESLNKDCVQTVRDESYGMVRDEVVCGRCGGHLGHVFDDGPAPTHLRYCMNGYALHFEETK